MTQSISHPRRIRFFAIAAAALVFASCGDDEAGRPKRYPASGRVVVDSAGAAGIQVRLVPVDRLHDIGALRPAGLTGADGSYRLGTYDEADGAPAGKYKVILFWPDNPDSQGRPKDLFGGEYSKPEASAIGVTIAEGENHIPDIEAHKAKVSAKPRATPRRKSSPDLNADGPTAK